MMKLVRMQLRIFFQNIILNNILNHFLSFSHFSSFSCAWSQPPLPILQERSPRMRLLLCRMPIRAILTQDMRMPLSLWPTLNTAPLWPTPRNTSPQSSTLPWPTTTHTLMDLPTCTKWDGIWSWDLNSLCSENKHNLEPKQLFYWEFYWNRVLFIFLFHFFSRTHILPFIYM